LLLVFGQGNALTGAKVRDYSDNDIKEKKDYYLQKAKEFFNTDKDSALYYLNTALEDEYIINNNDPSYLQRIHKGIASLYNRERDLAAALKHLLIAKEIVESNELLEKSIGLYQNLGMLYISLNDYEKSHEYYLKIIEIGEEIEDDSALQIGYSSLGMLFHYQELHDLAFDYYKKALELAKVNNSEEHIPRLTVNMGVVLKDKQNFDKALDFLFEALTMLQDRQQLIGQDYVFSNIGDTYKDMPDSLYIKRGQNPEKRFHIVLEHYLNSIAILKKQQVENTALIGSLVGIGELFIALQDFVSANKYLFQALDVANRIADNYKKKDIYKNLSVSHERQKNYKQSLEYYQLYSIYKDSVINEDEKVATLQRELKNLYDKKSFKDSLQSIQEIALKNAEIQQQEIVIVARKNQLFITLIGLLVSGLLLLLVFQRYRQNLKQKTIIQSQHISLQEKNKEILDSITYAKRLQDAILPPSKTVKTHLPESFILYKPKDIVAGDFYFMDVVEEKNKKLIYYVAADCTGHGVPGAMVSIVGANGLKRCIQEFGLREPGKILDKLSEIVAENFSQSEEKIRDGMDLAICCLEIENDQIKRVHYAGANNPLWVINPNRKKMPENVNPFKEGGGFEIRANKQAIGYTENIAPFDTHTFELETGDTLYTFSDGYADQFGGEAEKKYKSFNFRKFLLSIQGENMDEQKKLVNGEFENWKGELEQVDDVCVIGVRI
jgi:tetratricopeptide (TPR) repeat protein